MKFNARLFVAALGLVTVSSSALASIDVYVGYADGVRAAGFFPSPWSGDSGVTFFGGSGGSYDAGAIMFVNTGATAANLTAFDVNGYSVWGGLIGAGHSIGAGQKLILTQTADYNFDSSDYGWVAPPAVNYTLDGIGHTDMDTGLVLNTHGFDYAIIGNESFAWRLIGTNGNPSGTPAPAAGITMLLGLAARARRRRA